MGVKVVLDLFLFLIILLCLIGNKLNYFPQLISTQDLLIKFSPFLVRRGRDRESQWEAGGY